MAYESEAAEEFAFDEECTGCYDLCGELESGRMRGAGDDESSVKLKGEGPGDETNEASGRDVG